MARKNRIGLPPPFSTWKSIIRQLLGHLSIYTAAYSDLANKVKFKSFVGDPEAGLDFVLTKLLPGKENWRPLLGAIGVTRKIPDNEYTATLTGSLKTAKTAELLSLIIQQYTKISRKLTVMLIDDLQSIDHSSLFLLRELLLDPPVPRSPDRAGLWRAGGFSAVCRMGWELAAEKWLNCSVGNTLFS